MLVLTASIIGYSWSSKTNETLLSSAQHTEAKPRVPTTTVDDNSTPTAIASSENTASQNKQAEKHSENTTKTLRKHSVNTQKILSKHSENTQKTLR